MAFNIDEMTPDQIHKGMACKSLEEFQAYVKEQGFDLDEKEAQAIFEEMFAMELSDEELDAVAGGWDGRCSDNDCVNYTFHRRRK
mgnify:CR=1 FL=1